MGSMPEEVPELDVLLVGAGFASFTLMHRLRKQGLSIKIYEKGAATGGIWHWNCYPGARVDSDTPIYQLFDEELWRDWTFKERYPGGKELREYFDYVEEKWDLKKDIVLNKHVDSAIFDEKRKQWHVECADGSEVYCRYFIPCIGFASKHFNPPFKGLSDFKGEIYHTAKWPQHGVQFKGKRVAQVGTGASGIQCCQTIAPSTAHYTLYQRTPNMCLPMNQRKLDPKEEEEKKKNGWYAEQIKNSYNTKAGFTYDFQTEKTFDVSPEEREKFFHKQLIEEGGFRFWLGAYADIFSNMDANREAYEFWKKSVHKRIPDPKKRQLLAPDEPPHPFGTKRPSLEQNFYEVVSADHVDIVDINADPIVECTEKGLRTRDGGVVEVDAIILATGFDSVTGSLAQLNIQGVSGGTIADHWKDGLRTAIGIALNDFPNMFFLYGPQAPTAFSNGPSCTQQQADWVEATIMDLEKQGIKRFEAKKETEDEWTKEVNDVWNDSLFPLAKSWYQGSNIPGRRVEPLNWAGGFIRYREALANSVANNYQGWNIEK